MIVCTCYRDSSGCYTSRSNQGHDAAVIQFSHFSKDSNASKDPPPELYRRTAPLQLTILGVPWQETETSTDVD